MAATSRREKVSAVDTAWLRMDRPRNLMMICGVFMFRSRVEYARLKRTVEERFLVFRRFRQRAVELPGFAVWENDRHFDIDRHVVHIALPGRAGRKELQTLVSRLVATPLDPARPMWQFHLVDNYDGGSALIVRMHHCYADGIALVRVMLSMTDAAPDGPPAMPFEPRKRHKRAEDDVFAALMGPLTGVLKSATTVGAALVARGVGIWHDPAKAVTLAEAGGALTAEIAKLALMGQDSPTRFKGKPGVTKRVAWADPLPLPEVKTIGRALGASVNDVLLSSVAGALRNYLLAKGEEVADVVIRALVPVNLRPLEKAYKLNPDALDAGAPTSLGVLYYRVPSFPVAFGDKAKARHLLEQATTAAPDGLDAWYFYGDFLLAQGEYAKAREAFTHALSIPPHPDRPLWDENRRLVIREKLDTIKAKL
jgi:WS/DGAT/MGAT family acyltransferase